MVGQSGELQIEGINYHVTAIKRFQSYRQAEQADKRECFEFAYDMSYGRKGAHRDSRSGGKIHRTLGQIFINTFQGKMAEFALYRYLQNQRIDAERPDTSEYELGKWDAYDLKCQERSFAVKSTKSYGNLLLLETKDWNDNGEYIPNIASGNAIYDYTVLVRFTPDGESIMKSCNLLYQKNSVIQDNIKEVLESNIYAKNWTYDFAGFIYHNEVVGMIRDRCIIPQGAMLNGSTKMDAENYYFQAGNMHRMSELYRPKVQNGKIVDREGLLKRRCPKCGKSLVLRQGYNLFWGCEGYFDSPKCEYTEPL